MSPAAELLRAAEDARGERAWMRWGAYLAERQWGAAGEDESPESPGPFPHEQARSRAYRLREDGLLGICDRECRMCFAIALWNERDPILKERLFGLPASEGEHPEEARDRYEYLDATPTHSYLEAHYDYPQREFPYARLVEENRSRGRNEPGFELEDAGFFEDGRYFNVRMEYAKASPDDLLIRLTAENRGPEAATIHLLPTLWFRNTWGSGRSPEGKGQRPRIARDAGSALLAEHPSLGAFRLAAGLGPFGRKPAVLFTENETNRERLYGERGGPRFAKDAFHDYVVQGRPGAVNPARLGTKAALYYRVELPARERFTVRLRLTSAAEGTASPFGRAFDAVFEARIREADEFHRERLPEGATEEERSSARRAYAGLAWSKQFARRRAAARLPEAPPAVASGARAADDLAARPAT